MWTELRTAIGMLRRQRRFATFTREALEADKLARFRRFVADAMHHSPYYANLIKERGIRVDCCTPTDFPVLTKPLLMANFDSIVTDRRITKQGIADFLSRSTDPTDLMFDRYRVLHTSGTSGEERTRKFRLIVDRRSEQAPASSPSIGLASVRSARV